jgi:hypothetical protein
MSNISLQLIIFFMSQAVKNMCVNFDRNGALSKSYIVIIVKIKIVMVTKQLRLVNHTKHWFGKNWEVKKSWKTSANFAKLYKEQFHKLASSSIR